MAATVKCPGCNMEVSVASATMGTVTCPNCGRSIEIVGAPAPRGGAMSAAERMRLRKLRAQGLDASTPSATPVSPASQPVSAVPEPTPAPTPAPVSEPTPAPSAMPTPAPSAAPSPSAAPAPNPYQQPAANPYQQPQAPQSNPYQAPNPYQQPAVNPYQQPQAPQPNPYQAPNPYQQPVTNPYQQPYVAPTEQPMGMPMGGAKLVYLSRNGKVPYTLKPGSNTIGRADMSKPSDISIEGDSFMSRRSVEVVAEVQPGRGMTYRLTVLSSTNPVLVNDQRVEPGRSIYLNFGDTLMLGNSRFVLEG